MKRECHRTVRAFANVATLWTDERRREPAAIEEQDRLFLFREPIMDRGDQALGENCRTFRRLLAQVDDANEWHLFVIDARGQAEQLVLADLRIVKALERGRGAAEQTRAFLHTRPQHGQIPSVIARRFLLLVGVLVFFIDDNETEIRAWSEDGGPRSDDDARAALANLVPFIMTLAFTEVGVKDRDFVLRGGK